MDTRELKLSIESVSREYGEDNDCTVRAIAACTGGSYDEAHCTLKRLGRKHGRGTTMFNVFEALNQMGYNYQRVTEEFRSAKTIRTFMRSRNLSGRNFIVNVRGHVAAVVNGDNIDWTAEGRDGKPRMHRIIDVYEVTPMPQEDPEPRELEPEEVAQPLFTRKLCDNFIGQVYVALHYVYGDQLVDVPKRVDRKKICKLTGLAHRTVGFALTYLRRNNFSVKDAHAAWKADRA